MWIDTLDFRVEKEEEKGKYVINIYEKKRKSFNLISRRRVKLSSLIYFFSSSIYFDSISKIIIFC